MSEKLAPNQAREALFHNEFFDTIDRMRELLQTGDVAGAMAEVVKFRNTHSAEDMYVATEAISGYLFPKK